MSVVQMLFRRILPIIFIILLGSALSTLLFVNTFTFIQYLNTLFIISLIILVTGCTMIVIQGKAFNRFFNNFKHFWYNINKSEKAIRKIEGKKDPYVEDELPIGNIQSTTIIATVSGLFLVIVSIILSYVV